MTNTTALDLGRLEALAKAATPGPWTSGWPSIPFDEAVSRIYDEDCHTKEDAAFITAANPAAILQLIADLRAALAAKGQQEPVAWADEPQSKLYWAKGHPIAGRSGKVALTYAAPVAQQSEAGTQGALQLVLADLEAMTPHELRAELAKHRGRLRLEAPEPTEAGKWPHTIPEGVWYCAEHDNFYSGSKGMGQGSYGLWRARATEFPTSQPTEAGAPTVANVQINPSCCGNPENCPKDYRDCPHGGTPPTTSGRESAAPAAPVREGDREQDAKDAARYRWLRGSATDIGNVIDKEFAPGKWEYRAGEELDEAIDAAMQKGAQGNG